MGLSGPRPTWLLILTLNILIVKPPSTSLSLKHLPTHGMCVSIEQGNDSRTASGTQLGLGKWQLSEASELEETSGHLVQQKRKRRPSKATG